MSDTTPTPEPSSTPVTPPRRRFLRRAVVGTLVAGAVAGIGARALAHGGWSGWHRGGFMHAALDPAEVEERLDRILKHLYVEIDATEAQQQQLAPVVKAAVRDLLPVRRQIHDARGQAVALLSQPGVDRGALEALRAEQIRLVEQASRRLTGALADVADILTPEQRRTLAERLARRHGRPG
jgi:periplasmic protein CpxP/Spy